MELLGFNLTTATLVILLTYVILPCAVYLYLGGGYARLYAMISSTIAAVWIFLAPIQFLEAFIPESPVREWLLGLVTLFTAWLRYILAAIVFIVLYLFQFRFIAKICAYLFGLGRDRD